MKSAEDIIKTLKDIEGQSFNSTTSLLQKIGLSNLIITRSNSEYRNKSFIQLLFSNIKKIIPNTELKKVISQNLSNEAQVSSLKSSMLNQGFFSSTQIISFLDFDNIKQKQQAQITQDFFTNPDNIIIAFVNGDLPKSLDSLKSKSTLLELSPLKGPKLEKWIINECKKNGASGCEDLALQYLVKELGSDKIDEIVKIISKASLLSESESLINVKQILDCSVHKSEKDINDLFSAVARKDKLQINSSLKFILDSGSHPLQIYSYFSKAIKCLIANYDKSGNGENAKDLHNQWFVNKLQPRLFSKSRLESALNILSELEFGLKDNGLSHETIISHALIKL